jgi:cytochrome P450
MNTTSRGTLNRGQFAADVVLHAGQVPSGRPELRGAFLEEVLRYEPPFRGHYRHVVNNTTLCGVNLDAGFSPAVAVGGGQSGSVAFRRSQ